MNRWAKIGLPFAFVGAVFSGCTTLEAYSGETQVSGASKGAIAGGLIGAVIGAATAPKDERAKRAIIGAGIGGVTGGGVGYYMDRQEKKLRDELVGSGVQVRRTEEGQIDLIMPGNITFDVGSSDVSGSFQPTLRSVAKVLKEYDDTLVTISGHTDSSGSDQFNQMLSEQRASAVAAILLNQGIVVERIAATGYGETRPVATNNTAEGRSANRRVEITLDAIVAN